MVEGQVERRGEAVARWAPLMVVGKFGGRPGGGVSGEGRWRGGRVNAPPHHWGRGGGMGAREMAACGGAARPWGWHSAGGRSGTTLTGGFRPSMRG
jgi:hypothetical protein